MWFFIWCQVSSSGSFPCWKALTPLSSTHGPEVPFNAVTVSPQPSDAQSPSQAMACGPHCAGPCWFSFSLDIFHILLRTRSFNLSTAKPPVCFQLLLPPGRGPEWPAGQPGKRGEAGFLICWLCHQLAHQETSVPLSLPPLANTVSKRNLPQATPLIITTGHTCPLLEVAHDCLPRAPGQRGSHPSQRGLLPAP